MAKYNVCTSGTASNAGTEDFFYLYYYCYDMIKGETDGFKN